jgi:hypothetical protein
MKTKNIEKQNAVSLGRELLSTAQDTNNVLTTATVPSIFQGHYFNLETESHGVIALITEILTEHEAIFPLGVESTEFRKTALATALTAEDIMSEIQNKFTAGSTRYPYETIHQNLSIVMFRSKKVGKIRMTNAEDKPRPCNKPRCKWYLVQ